MEVFNKHMDSDSLDDSRDDKLLQAEIELKQKNVIIEEKSRLILELRQQVEDRDGYIEELESRLEQERLKSKQLSDTLKERDEEIEAMSRYSQEVDLGYETMKKKLDARTEQLQKLFDELTKTKKDLDENRNQLEQLTHKNELLTVELKTGGFKKRSRQESDHIEEEEISRLKHELEVSESSHRMERHHKERIAYDNKRLENKLNELTTRLSELEDQNVKLNSKCRELETKQHYAEKALPITPPPPIPPKDSAKTVTKKVVRPTDENAPETISSARLEMADELGEIMYSQPLKTRMMENNGMISSKSTDHQFPTNNKIQKSQFYDYDPKAQERMRLERAMELNRRNKLTKPLHQTSYPLELDLYDEPSTEKSENRPDRMIRKALSPCPVNLNVYQRRKPVKKAEAFIV